MAEGICESKIHFDALDNGTLFKHLSYAVYKHERCPVCSNDESFLIIWKCGDIKRNHMEAVMHFSASNDLGSFSHYEDATSKDIFNITTIIQYVGVVNNPESAKHIGYCYRKFLKRTYRKNRKVLNDALKMAKYEFDKKYSDELSLKIYKHARVARSKITAEFISSIEEKSKPNKKKTEPLEAYF